MQQLGIHTASVVDFFAPSLPLSPSVSAVTVISHRIPSSLLILMKCICSNVCFALNLSFNQAGFIMISGSNTPTAWQTFISIAYSIQDYLVCLVVNSLVQMPNANRFLCRYKYLLFLLKYTLLRWKYCVGVLLDFCTFWVCCPFVSFLSSNVMQDPVCLGLCEHVLCR